MPVLLRHVDYDVELGQVLQQQDGLFGLDVVEILDIDTADAAGERGAQLRIADCLARGREIGLGDLELAPLVVEVLP